MSKLKYAIVLVLSAALLCVPVNAAELSVDATTQFCFSSADFSVNPSDDGIFILSVPSENVASVLYGNRVLKAGDALTAQALDELTVQTACVTEQTASLEYCTVGDGKVSGVQSLKLAIRPKKNHPPEADPGFLETYKNISNNGTLKATDPEGAAMTFHLHDAPKRGTVEIQEDGTYCYTPGHNKVGNDSFTFTVTDDAGNVSEPAKIVIKIKKPTDSTTYADMTDDADQFAAMWLKENDIYSGSAVGGKLCFGPDKTVDRGEFLVMVMKLVGVDRELTQATSGFADEADTPGWLQPYISTALSNGMVSGTVAEEGVFFRPADAMTKAEAAVMLQKILSLPTSDTAAVFAQTSEPIVPAWAMDAFGSMQAAGIKLDTTSEDGLLTNRDVARLLYDVSVYLTSASAETFYWQK